MALAVARVLADRQHLIVEAGTGVGKSFGYLVPAILWATENEGQPNSADDEDVEKRRIVISTHTISLQEQLLTKDLPLLNSVIPRNYVSLRRLNMAQQRSAQVLHTQEELDQLKQLGRWARTTTDGSRSDLSFTPLGSVWDEVASDTSNCLGRKCATYNKCHYFAARRRMQNAQILVVNHALFFSDLALRRQGISILPDYAAVIFDEAHTIEAVAGDHLGIGIDPAKVTFYLQSAVHEIYELQLLLSGLVTVERLQQLPTIKDMASAAHLEQMPYNLLGYPVLQSADILMPRAHLVPVGKDNESHVEITRQIARRFNNLYGEVFPEPDSYVEGGTLVGTDGQAKMSKSLGNAILLSDDSRTVKKQVMSMYTDPNRISADIPGNVEGNPVFSYHDIFNPNTAEVDDLKERYRAGRVGDVEVKEKLFVALENFLDPIRERRAHYEAQTGFVDELLYEGTQRAQQEARATLIEVKKAMGLTGVWNRIRRAVERRRKKAGNSE